MNSILLVTMVVASDSAVSKQNVIVVIGAPGSEEYGEQFETWSDRWRQAAEQGDARFQRLGSDDHEIQDRDRLKQALADVAKVSPEPLWLVLIGHGTFDGRQAKFNLRGPDVSATELKDWLKPIARPTILINCSSSSSPFLNQLSAPNRVIITATKSGHEQNFARFGNYFSTAIVDPKADLDKDDQVSLLEAFLAASSRVADFYKEEARLATEHALLDDNGDGLGTPANWFRGVRVTRFAKQGASADGVRAHQIHLVRSPREESLTAEARVQRDRLERDIAELRAAKDELATDDYYQRLEQLLLKLAALYSDARPLDK